ncbi:MAG: hypothetical protein MUF33_05965 [Candidatus Nanopelagicales bacterium]|jgi:P pilus assembly chaperone PapD|nr:hypothetical protein [Candidatus Nanopelagicales bacterium]
MSNAPRIIAVTASAALLAATGAGAAVLALDLAQESIQMSQDSAAAADLQAPQDERTTVYRAPQNDDDWDDEGDDEDSSSQFTPAPPTTTFQGGKATKTPANTSKSS